MSEPQGSPRGVFVYGGGSNAGSPAAFPPAVSPAHESARFWVPARGSAGRAAAAAATASGAASPTARRPAVVRPSLPSSPRESGTASPAQRSGAGTSSRGTPQESPLTGGLAALSLSSAGGSGTPAFPPPTPSFGLTPASAASPAAGAFAPAPAGGSAGVLERALAAAAASAAAGGIVGATWLSSGPERAGEHSWFSLSGETFATRGPAYLRDRVKTASARPPCDLMMSEMFLSEDKVGNVAAREGSFLRAARRAGDSRFYVVVTYVTPTAPFVHVTFYYAVDGGRMSGLPHLRRLWTRFTERGPAGDAFRRERWKVIPRIAEGSWVVSSAVGTKPALLAQKLEHTWIFGDDAPAMNGGALGAGGNPGAYLESDCDVASSTVALMLVGMLQTWAKSLVIDLGFAIEPLAADEFPEVVLAAVRLNRLDTTKPPLVAAAPTDCVLGSKTGATHADIGAGGGDESAGAGRGGGGSLPPTPGSRRSR